MRLILMSVVIWLSLNYTALSQVMSLDMIINNAVKVNPKLNLLQKKIKVEKTKIDQLSNLPDPMVKLGFGNLPVNSFSFTQEPMTSKFISFNQAVPFPGRLASIEKVFDKNVDIAEEIFKDSRNYLIEDISKSYYMLQFQQEAIKTTQRIHKLINSIYEVVQKKYTVGEASQQNLFSISIEISKIEEKIEMLRSKEMQLRNKLNAYLMRPMDSELTTESLKPVVSITEQLNDAIKKAEENNPHFIITKHEQTKFENLKSLNEYDYYPNFNFGVQYSQRNYLSMTGKDLNDLITFSVGFNLPLNYGGKNSAKVEEAELLKKISADKFEVLKQEYRIMFSKVFSELQEYKNREIIIANKLLPQAEKSVETALADYKTGITDFANVILAQKDLLKYNLDLLEVRSKAEIVKAEINKLTGVSSDQYSMEIKNEK